MTIVRRVARPMLAAQFIWGGIDTFRHPGPRAETARPVLEMLSGPLHLPNDPENIVRANAAVMTGAGVMLAFGRFPRLAGAVLAATMVPTTYAGHPFWQEKDPDLRRQQRTHFLKNMGLLGGVLLAAVDTEARPGLAWRARRAARDAKREARHAKRGAQREAARAMTAARAALPG
jgi:putative oxidoreductase